MVRTICRTLALTAVAGLLALPAQGLETTLLFGRPDGGELGGFGWQVRSAGDLDADGRPDIVAGAPYDSALGENVGRAFVWFSGRPLTGEPHLILEGQTGQDFFGFAVAGVGDLDDDGFDDLAVGAPRASAGGGAPRTGVVYIYRGGPGMDGIPDQTLAGEVGGDRFGWSVAPAGDMDRDGIDDLVVGAPYNNLGGTNVGRAYLYTGQSVMGAVGPAADVVYSGVAGGAPTNSTWFAAFAPDGVPLAGSGFGFSVAHLPDFRGNGRSAIAVGAPGQSGATGRVFVFYAAAATSTLPSNSPSVTVNNSTANEEFGWAVHGAGDLDGDFRTDLLVGAPGAGGSTGRVNVYYGSANPAATISSPSFSRVAGIAGDRFGHAVAGAGDVNGSGNNWLVGAPAEDSAGLSAGRVYLYEGAVSVPVQIGPENAGGAPVAEDQWGFSVDGLLGDLDGDGLDDFLVGAPTGNAQDNAVRGVMAIVATTQRIVATPALRLSGTERDGGLLRLDFTGEIAGAIEDAELRNDGRVLARLGAGIWPGARGLTAEIAVGEIRGTQVELLLQIDGSSSTQHFELPAVLGHSARLHPATPNPFNPRTTLTVELPSTSEVQLRVFDLRGRMVRELFAGTLPAGLTPIDFDGLDGRGRPLASGAYLAVLETGETRSSTPLTLVQ